MDLSANAGALCTKFRNPAEHNFQYIWACKYFGRGAGIDQQLLNPCNRLPDPDAPVVSKVLVGKGWEYERIRGAECLPDLRSGQYQALLQVCLIVEAS
jgi:hypothetical protein